MYAHSSYRGIDTYHNVKLEFHNSEKYVDFCEMKNSVDLYEF